MMLRCEYCICNISLKLSFSSYTNKLWTNNCHSPWVHRCLQSCQAQTTQYPAMHTVTLCTSTGKQAAILWPVENITVHPSR